MAAYMRAARCPGDSSCHRSPRSSVNCRASASPAFDRFKKRLQIVFRHCRHASGSCLRIHDDIEASIAHILPQLRLVQGIRLKDEASYTSRIQRSDPAVLTEDCIRNEEMRAQVGIARNTDIRCDLCRTVLDGNMHTAAGVMRELQPADVPRNVAASAFKAVGVFAILPCSRTSTRLSESASATAIVSLVHVQADVGDRLVHDPSPMHEARHRPSGPTLENLHTLRRVAPYLRRTSGLGRCRITGLYRPSPQKWT